MVVFEGFFVVEVFVLMVFVGIGLVVVLQRYFSTVAGISNYSGFLEALKKEILGASLRKTHCKAAAGRGKA